MKDEDADSHAINAQPWDPPPGMAKQQCLRCRYFFATSVDAPARLCPDCAAEGARTTAPIA